MDSRHHCPMEVGAYCECLYCFKMCNGLSRLKLNEFFTLADNTRGIRGHSRKLVKFRCTRDCCKYFFSNRVNNRWNQLDQRVVDASSINAFKGFLNKTRETTGP